MDSNKYWDEFPSAVTICDTEAVVVYMNRKAESTFEKWGGRALIGKSLFGCHSERSCEMIRQILTDGVANTYTIEKNGKKKLIHQTPWFENNKLAGITEISIELPEGMRHIKR